MGRRTIYSSARSRSGGAAADTGRGGIPSAAATPSLGAPTRGTADPSQLKGPGAFRGKFPALLADPSRRQFAIIVFLAAALVVALLLVVFTPRQKAITQLDIDRAVDYSLTHNPPQPPRAQLAYEAVEHAVVKIRQIADEGPSPKELGVGTGVVISQAGLILTNFHVIAGAPQLVGLFADGTESPLDVSAADPDRDIALLQARHPPDELEPATLRSVAGLKTGDEVFAVGFPFGIGPSLSAGVVSGLDRSYVSPLRGNVLTGLIQFDAAANPGNSGGPLVDRNGDVVGLVSSILNPNAERVFIGIAFAVPIDSATGGFALNPF